MYLNELDVTLSAIQGKWKAAILYSLLDCRRVRFNTLKRCIPDISHKALMESLNQLIEDGLVEREDLSTHILHVEYSLSSRGKSVIPVLDVMCEWGEANSTIEKLQQPLCIKEN